MLGTLNVWMLILITMIKFKHYLSFTVKESRLPRDK